MIEESTDQNHSGRDCGYLVIRPRLYSVCWMARQGTAIGRVHFFIYLARVGFSLAKENISMPAGLHLEVIISVLLGEGVLRRLDKALER